ncbi:PspC domain-containing protein [Candidatus Saccharibacteria bacterium]|nr:PspC domain-containing protein [Candidatus Saccharibacteria bacterium]
MNKTESVSIGRKGFVCEQDAYEILNKYLKRSEKSLVGDPDRHEILQDLEMALSGHLSHLAGELVVDVTTANKAIKIMGEVQSSTDNVGVEGDFTDESEEISNSQKLQNILKKSLYKDHNREIIDGVCSGIAKSIDTDPIWVRIGFVVFTIITNGFGLLFYIVLMLIMKDTDEDKRRSASEVVGDVKDKIQNNLTPRRAYESALYKLIRGVGRFTVLVIRVIILIFMLLIGMAWSTLLFFMITSPNKVVLFGANPSWVDFTAIISFGFVVLIPLFVLIATLVGSNIVKSVRFSLLTWCFWVIAILVSAGSLINVVPDVRARLLQDQPKTKNVYVEVENNKIIYTCITLWGDCHEGIPKLTIKKICDTEVQVVAKDDWDQYSNLQLRGWTMGQKSFIYPANINDYCLFVKSIVDSKGFSNAVFDDREINDEESRTQEIYNIMYDDMTPVRPKDNIESNWNIYYFTRRTL